MKINELNKHLDALTDEQRQEIKTSLARLEKLLPEVLYRELYLKTIAELNIASINRVFFKQQEQGD